MVNCTCANSAANLGTPNCVEVMKYAQSFFIMNLVDDAGTANYIASGATVDSSYILARLNDTDSSQRWQILKNVKNAIIAERADDVFESFDDGSQTFVEEGVATTSFIIASQTPTLVGKLKSHRCNKLGFMYVDKDGRLWGKADSAGNLYPIAIEEQPLSVKAAYPTPTANYNIPVSFKWRKDMFDEDLGYWDNSIDWSSPTIRSIIDVYAALDGAVTTTGFTVDLYYSYGAQNSKTPVEGLVTADFVSSDSATASRIYNITDNSDVTITVTESATVAGRYTFAYAAQTSADELQLAASKQGFDFSALLDLTILIP